jgi:hypothetical protein
MKPVFQFASVNLEDEVQSFIPAASQTLEQPVFTIYAGPPATGKSELRRTYHSATSVTIDAGDIFLSLCRNRLFAFPPRVFTEEVEWIGTEVTRRAFQERRNIVCEISMVPFEEFQHIPAILKAFGYSVSLQWIDCGVEEAMRRNQGRGKESISSYYTDDYHLRWLCACLESHLT